MCRALAESRERLTAVGRRPRGVCRPADRLPTLWFLVSFFLVLSLHFFGHRCPFAAVQRVFLPAGAAVQQEKLHWPVKLRFSDFSLIHAYRHFMEWQARIVETEGNIDRHLR